MFWIHWLVLANFQFWNYMDLPTWLHSLLTCWSFVVSASSWFAVVSFLLVYEVGDVSFSAWAKVLFSFSNRCRLTRLLILFVTYCTHFRFKTIIHRIVIVIDYALVVIWTDWRIAATVLLTTGCRAVLVEEVVYGLF